jgi:ribosome-binding factor A
MSSHRIEKINQLVRSHLDEIIQKNLSLKEGVFVTIAKVDTTGDLRYTRVFVSVFPEQDGTYVMRALEKELYSIQGQLNKKLKMKILPRVEFHLDHTESRADVIEKLLKEI